MIAVKQRVGTPQMTFDLLQPGPIEPRAFCQRYARLKEGEYGYKGYWTRFLAHCLKLSNKTVEGWGSPPEYPSCPERYKAELARINALKVAELLLEQQELTQEYLKRLD